MQWSSATRERGRGGAAAAAKRRDESSCPEGAINGERRAKKEDPVSEVGLSLKSGDPKKKKEP